MAFSNERYSRHAEFLPPNGQDRLSKSRLAILGCGVGSPLALNLARLGIATQGELILADPDTVDFGNLNRQGYLEHQVGINKAQALSDVVKMINSDVRTRVVPEGVTLENVGNLVNGLDVIAEMVDVAKPLITIAIHREARAKGIPVITGFDLGEGVMSYVFDYRDKNQMSLDRFLGIKEDMPNEDLNSLDPLAVATQYLLGPTDEVFNTPKELTSYYDSLIALRQDDMLNVLPEEMRHVFVKLIKGDLHYIPQTNGAANLMGVVHSVIIQRLLLGEKVTVAPTAVNLNLLQLIGN